MNHFYKVVANLILFFVPLFLLDCKTSSNVDVNPGEYYVKFKADNKDYIIVEKTNEGRITCNLVTGPGSGGSIGLSAIKFPGPYPAMNFLVKSKEEIKVKEYKSDDAGNVDPNFLMVFALPIVDPQKKYEQYQISKGITFNVTEITADHVKGTFSSKEINDPTLLTPAVTDGEFFAIRRD